MVVLSRSPKKWAVITRWPYYPGKAGFHCKGLALNVIKVLSAIDFGPKCYKNPNSSGITMGPKLDKVAVTETCNGLMG